MSTFVKSSEKAPSRDPKGKGHQENQSEPSIHEALGGRLTHADMALPRDGSDGPTRPIPAWTSYQRAFGNQRTLHQMQSVPSNVFGRLLPLSPVLGNHGTARLQAKLRVGAPGDPYEQEADRIADMVMLKPGSRAEIGPVRSAATGLQRKCSCSGSASKCDTCQDEEQTLQRWPSSSAPAQDLAPPVVHQALQTSGRPLDSSTRAFMETRFGRDFRDVRIHTDVTSGESAAAVKAFAYTVGHDVVFAHGSYEPSSEHGRRLLAHELTHVVQQSQGAPPAVQRDTRNPSDTTFLRNAPGQSQANLMLGFVPQLPPQLSKQFVVRAMSESEFQGLTGVRASSLPEKKLLSPEEAGLTGPASAGVLAGIGGGLAVSPAITSPNGFPFGRGLQVLGPQSSGPGAGLNLPPPLQSNQGPSLIPDLQNLRGMQDTVVTNIAEMQEFSPRGMWQVGQVEYVKGRTRVVVPGQFRVDLSLRGPETRLHAEIDGLNRLAQQIPRSEWKGARIRMIISQENCPGCVSWLESQAKAHGCTIETYIPSLPDTPIKPKSAVARATREGRLEDMTLVSDQVFNAEAAEPLPESLTTQPSPQNTLPESGLDFNSPRGPGRITLAFEGVTGVVRAGGWILMIYNTASSVDLYQSSSAYDKPMVAGELGVEFTAGLLGSILGEIIGEVVLCAGTGPAMGLCVLAAGVIGGAVAGEFSKDTAHSVGRTLQDAAELHRQGKLVPEIIEDTARALGDQDAVRKIEQFKQVEKPHHQEDCDPPFCFRF